MSTRNIRCHSEVEVVGVGYIQEPWGIHMYKGRSRRSKETDGCPLTQPYTLTWQPIFPRSIYFGMAITHREQIGSLTGWKVTQQTESSFSWIHMRK
jgi:hypothetical protein